MNDVKTYRVFFIFSAIFFTIIGGGLIVLSIMVDYQLSGHEFLTLSMAVVCAVQAYLVPQFIINDERVKLIKQKAMFTGYFFIMGYSVIFMILLNTGIIQLTAQQLLGIFTALIVSTVFLLFVFFSKRY
ncbi:permease [Alkalicoccobacillus gibsonii]|uniref:permease n=1 Tax=Alkalicoccobacillus gibsonii TaxID=79881 RepID=UPI0019320FD1|nr:permease [Alkalicoccobacillus gibsonii]MBM0065354.1 permease [Alkalicoccobacillus gibsonii]